jgi:hypothetical protein
MALKQNMKKGSEEGGFTVVGTSNFEMLRDMPHVKIDYVYSLSHQSNILRRENLLRCCRRGNRVSL